MVVSLRNSAVGGFECMRERVGRGYREATEKG
jgi:hypothetical protein